MSESSLKGHCAVVERKTKLSKHFQVMFLKALTCVIKKEAKPNSCNDGLVKI